MAELRQLVRADCDAVPLPCLKSLSNSIFARRERRYRLDDAAELLRSRPGDAAAAELYLLELIRKAQRQIGGSIGLGPTFAGLVDDMDDELKAALPTRTQEALAALGRQARTAPVLFGEAMDQRALAHALVVDGKLTGWLVDGDGSDGASRTARPKDADAAFRRLAQRFHPDREGGDAEVMRDLNRIRNGG